MFIALIDIWNRFQDFVKPATVELAKVYTIAFGATQGLSPEESLKNSAVEGEVDRVLNARKRLLDEVQDNLQTDIDADKSGLEAKLARIAEAEREFLKQLESNRADEIAAAEADVERARREFEDALAAAKAGREAADAEDGPDGSPPGAEDFAAKLEELLAAMRGGVSAAADAAVRGTFDPSAIGQQFAPSVSIQKEQRDLMKRAVDAVEPMQRGVDDIRDSLPVFA